MAAHWNQPLDLVIGLSPEELIGAILSALALSAATAGLYFLTRKKASDRFLLLVGLLIVANVICMALSAGYLQAREKSLSTEDGPFNGVVFSGLPPAATPAYGSPGTAQPPQAREPFKSLAPCPSADQFFQAADADGDARLSPEEAAQFVRAAGAGDDGTVDRNDFASALWSHTASPPGLPEADDSD